MFETEFSKYRKVYDAKITSMSKWHKFREHVFGETKNGNELLSFGDKRLSSHPISFEIMEEICSRIANGAALYSLCKEPGIPNYNAVCRWRRECPLFEENLKMAYKDRADQFKAEVIDIANNCTEDNAESCSLKIETLKNSYKYIYNGQPGFGMGSKSRKKQIGATFVLDTGPRRKPEKK
jgi:hypothetical protein